jgi:hypothetical protein
VGEKTVKTEQLFCNFNTTFSNLIMKLLYLLR